MPIARAGGVLSVSLLTATGASALLLLAGPGAADVAHLAGDPVGWVTARGSEQAVVVVAALAAWGLVVYLSLGVALTAVAHANGALGATAAALSCRWVPGSVRRLAELALGVTVVSGSLVGLAGPAAAAASSPDVVATGTSPAGDDWPGMSARPDDKGRLYLVAARPPAAVPAATKRSPAATVAVQLPEIASKPATPATEPGWSPDWPTAGLPNEDQQAEPTGAAGERGVVVRCGDTLWALAEQHLGPEASDDEIHVEWQRWHAANRAVIGADPHSIRPGQRLLPPGQA